MQQAKNRLLVALVLDTSDSMNRMPEPAPGNGRQLGIERPPTPIEELNQALTSLHADLRQRDALHRTAEIALVTFGEGGVRIVDPSGLGRTVDTQPFVPIGEFRPGRLSAGGYSPMEDAVRRALAIADRRRQELQAQGIGKAYRHLIFLITDGAPSDPNGEPSRTWRVLVAELRQRTGSTGDDRILFAGFAVFGADRDLLESLAPGCIHDAAGSSFAEILGKVVASIERAGRGRDDDVLSPEKAQQFQRIRDYFRSNPDVP